MKRLSTTGASIASRMAAVSAALLILIIAIVPAGCVKGKRESTTSIYSLASAGGTLEENGEGGYTLRLDGMSQTAMRYTMRPNREAGPVKTSTFVKSWDETFGSGSAVAALSIDVAAGEDAAVMTLSDPVHDAGAKTLTFRVEEESAHGGGSSWVGKPVSQLPSGFAAATLFIEQGSGEPSATPILVREGAVSISFRGPYYYVNIDMTRGDSRYRTGQQYAEAINRMNPDAGFRISTYVSTLMVLLATEYDISGSELLARAAEIKKSLPQEYAHEIDGLASGMKSYFPLSSSDLMYLYSMLPDVFRWSSCSSLAAWGPSSTTGTNIVHRTLDWYEGLLDELTEIQAVVRYHFADRDVHIIGALGHMGCITGISTADPEGRNGIMGAIMDADVTGSEYSSSGCRSYNFDLRYALEHISSTEEIAGFMVDRPYTFSHVVLLADAGETILLENNVSGWGDRPSRAVRRDDSVLNPGIEWGYPSMISAVNGFCLAGQVNNFSKGLNGEINVERWALLREKIEELQAERGRLVLSPEDVMEIMLSYRGSTPGSLEADEGDLYNQQTQQMALYVPSEGLLEVFFKPLDGSTSGAPAFINIPLERAR